MKIAVIFDNSVATQLASQEGSALPSLAKNSLTIKFLRCYIKYISHNGEIWGGKCSFNLCRNRSE